MNTELQKTYIEVLDEYTEDEFVKCLLHKVQGNYKAILDTTQWLKWNGRYWEYDERKTIHEKLLELKDELIKIGKARKQKLFIAEAKKLGNYSKSETVIKEAFKIAGDHKILVKELNGNPQLIALANGTLDLNRLEFREHRKEDLITEINNIEYDKDAKAEKWEKFILETFKGDEDIIRYLQKFFGYTLTGETNEHKLLYLYGIGANGKSTFINTIKKVSGSYAINLPSEQFMRNSYSNADMLERTKARLVGKRLGIVSEVSIGKTFNEAFIKELVSGDFVTARHIQQSAFEYKPSAKIVMIGNHKPKVMLDDQAFFRRIMMVPFDHIVPEKCQDRELERKLEKELPGILNWMIEGLRLYKEEGLKKVPDRIRTANMEYRNECNMLKEFIKDHCEHSEKSLKVTDLKTAYNEWQKTQGEHPKPMNSKNLCTKLRNMKYELYLRGGAQYCKGIGLIKSN